MINITHLNIPKHIIEEDYNTEDTPLESIIPKNAFEEYGYYFKGSLENQIKHTFSKDYSLEVEQINIIAKVNFSSEQFVWNLLTKKGFIVIRTVFNNFNKKPMNWLYNNFSELKPQVKSLGWGNANAKIERQKQLLKAQKALEQQLINAQKLLEEFKILGIFKKGLPDFFAYKSDENYFFVEVKLNSKLSNDQEKWIKHFLLPTKAVILKK